MWPANLSVRLPIAGLVSRYLANCLIGRELILQRISPLVHLRCRKCTLCGISVRFQTLSPSVGQIAHALLTRPPLRYSPKQISPFDLHVLSAPPAFVLSQDQTLQNMVYYGLSPLMPLPEPFSAHYSRSQSIPSGISCFASQNYLERVIFSSRNVV
jgi:hypothetical protein